MLINQLISVWKLNFVCTMVKTFNFTSDAVKHNIVFYPVVIQQSHIMYKITCLHKTRIQCYLSLTIQCANLQHGGPSNI